MKIIISEDFLFEDRKQFENLITKRKNNGVQVTDKDVANIEELSFSDGYLVLFAKLYFNEVDNGIDGYVAKQTLKSISNIIKERPNIIKVLQKPLFQYNDLFSLRSDIELGLQTLSAKTFYKKIPAALKSEDDFKHYLRLMANAEIKIKEHGIENIVFKKVSKFNNLYQFLLFIDRIIEGLSSFDGTLKKYGNSKNVELIFKNEQEQALLYVAKNESGVDTLTENTSWCISQDYGSEYLGYRNQYSNNGNLTFFRLYNFLSEDEDNNSVGFFNGKYNINSAYNLADKESSQVVEDFLETFDINLSKHSTYTYEFYEDEYEDEYEEEEEESNSNSGMATLRFNHLAEVFADYFNISFTEHRNVSGVLSDVGRQFVDILNDNVEGEGNSFSIDIFNYRQEYEDLIQKYFPNKNKISTKQIINFFEKYYDGFKFNYQHSGQDLFGDVSTTTVKQPLEEFMNKLSEVGIPIDLNESKKTYNKLIITEEQYKTISETADVNKKIDPYGVSISWLMGDVNYDAYDDLYPGYNYTKPQDINDDDKEFYFDSKEKAIEEIENVFFQFDNLPDPIPIYRVMGVKDLKDIDYDDLGASWSYNKDSAIGFSQRYNIRGVLLSGLIEKKHVHWESTLKTYLEFSLGLFGEEEHEIVVPNTDNITNLKVQKLK